MIISPNTARRARVLGTGGAQPCGYGVCLAQAGRVDALVGDAVNQCCWSAVAAATPVYITGGGQPDACRWYHRPRWWGYAGRIPSQHGM